MGQFKYKATDANGSISEGIVGAKTKDEAADLLTRRGITPLVIHEVSQTMAVHGSIPPVDKITFCRYMHVMLSTGLSISEGIEVLKGETKNPLLLRILSDMAYSLEQGQSLSTIFERYPTVFEKYFLTLVHAGESSGKLGEVFKHLEAELRAEHSLSSKVKGALLYPAVVFTAMIGIGILMFFFVLPQIGKVFLSLNMALPETTKLLFTVSIAVSGQKIPIFVGSLAGLVVFVISLRKKVVRRFLFLLIRPVPVVRNLIKKVDMARFTRILSTLIKSAVPITEALEISLDTLSWYEFRDKAAVMPDEVRRGKSLANVFREQKVFPSLMVQMIAAGEKTASLDATLADLASFYEGEVEEEVKALTQIIEPVLMLMVGITVGAMILSIIAPIYSVVGNFQNAAGPPRR